MWFHRQTLGIREVPFATPEHQAPIEYKVTKLMKLSQWRRAILLTGPLAALCIGITCYLILASVPSRITAQNANRIESGMTLDEVDQILGPERDESYGELTYFPMPSIGDFVITKNGPLYQPKRWIGQEIVITVLVNIQTGRGHSVQTFEPIPNELSSWENIRNRFKALFK
jgi:hypothetical protein